MAIFVAHIAGALGGLSAQFFSVQNLREPSLLAWRNSWHTDSGRKVTGGGGIHPDLIVPEADLNHFQKTLLRANVFFRMRAVWADTVHYLATRPVITKDFEVDEAVLSDFLQFVTAENISCPPAELAQNLDWVKRKIKQEIFLSTFGQQESLKVGARGGSPGDSIDRSGSPSACAL